jgi:hypothetical protein
MINKLLGTTALAGVAALVATAASAQNPQVIVGGFADFQAGYTDQDLDATSRSLLFQNDTEIHVKVDGKADNGLGYGAVVELEADASADADGEGFNSDKTYLFLQGNWGRFELGATKDAAQALKVDASTFASATGGVDGDWYDFVNVPAGYIIAPDLPIAYGAGSTAGLAGSSEDSTKIVYYSPRFSGFQIGLNYSPDAGNVGTAAGFTADNNGDVENVIGGGINYTGTFSNVGLALSATGETGDAENAALEDHTAYAFGGNLSYMGFTFGGSWGDWTDSLQVSAAPDVDADFWNLGVGYEFGPFSASAQYFDSELGNNDFDNIIIGADYKLAPGLVPYAEVSIFDFEAPGVASDNEGTVFLLGTQLTF